jgi:hypothetical protein
MHGFLLVGLLIIVSSGRVFAKDLKVTENARGIISGRSIEGTAGDEKTLKRYRELAKTYR